MQTNDSSAKTTSIMPGAKFGKSTISENMKTGELGTPAFDVTEVTIDDSSKDRINTNSEKGSDGIDNNASPAAKPSKSFIATNWVK